MSFSSKYWNDRYAKGGNSGAGSYGRLAVFKAHYLNYFCWANNVQTVIEIGSGDGNQVSLSAYPSYLGFDVSLASVELCKKMYGDDKTKQFRVLGDYSGEHAELVLSLDVVYHLVEESTFHDHMRLIFDASDKYVVIYSSNTSVQDENLHDGKGVPPHVRHRRFHDWIESNRPDFELISEVPNPYPFNAKDPKNTSFSDFYVYKLRHTNSG